MSNHITKDYLADTGQLQKRQAYTPDGWFRSGDVGRVTSQDDVMLMGRSDDAILYGPYTIFPQAIENVLEKCPGVAMVTVVPISDPATHHKLCACVIKSPSASSSSFRPNEGKRQSLTAKDVQEFMERQLTTPPNPYLPVPHDVIFKDEFPRVTFGKVNRKKLAKMAEDELKSN